MKRYYICRKVGDGTEANPIRAKVMDYAYASSTAIYSGAKNWCLAIVAAADHTEIAADADCYQIPDLSLDAKLSTLPTTIRSKLLQKLTDAGLPVSVTTNDTVRTLLRQIAGNIVPAWSEDRFDAKEPQ